ncbi:MAG: site-2 protease family protein [bacterium]
MSSSYVIFFQIFILIYSIVLHELGHAYMALFFGDETAKRMGRLTLVPWRHLELFGSFLLPLFLFFSGIGFLFAWAKPVPINLFYVKAPRLALFFVALAGPVVNVVLMGIFFVLWVVFKQSVFASLCVYGMYLNFVLALFNLLPIPPLDGSKLLLSFLPSSIQSVFYRYEMYGMVLLALLFFVGGLDWIFRVSHWFFSMHF